MKNNSCVFLKAIVRVRPYVLEGTFNIGRLPPLFAKKEKNAKLRKIPVKARFHVLACPPLSA